MRRALTFYAFNPSVGIRAWSFGSRMERRRWAPCMTTARPPFKWGDPERRCKRAERRFARFCAGADHPGPTTDLPPRQ